jgi:hypothetical protein
MCLDLLQGFGQLGFDHLTECYTVHCRYETYKKHFLEKKPTKMHRVSQYGVCFMAALDHMMSEVDKRGPQHKLSVIVEDGHNNARDTARLFKGFTVTVHLIPLAKVAPQRFVIECAIA